MTKNFDVKNITIDNITRISDNITTEIHYNFGYILFGDSFINGYFQVTGENFNLEIAGIKLFLEDFISEKYFYVIFGQGINTKFLVLPKEKI